MQINNSNYQEINNIDYRDIIYHILCMLDEVDLIKCNKVCKLWYFLVTKIKSKLEFKTAYLCSINKLYLTFSKFYLSNEIHYNVIYNLKIDLLNEYGSNSFDLYLNYVLSVFHCYFYSLQNKAFLNTDQMLILTKEKLNNYSLNSILFYSITNRRFNLASYYISLGAKIQEELYLYIKEIISCDNLTVAQKNKLEDILLIYKT